MNAFDFISDSPRTYIFQKSSNKTNFGGILTLVYLLILALIIFLYLYDFFKNYYQKYEVTYFYNQFRDETYRDQQKKEYNPLIELSFKVVDDEGELLDDDFGIILYDKNGENGEALEMGEKISKNIDDFKIAVFYVCPDNNCTFESKNFSDLIYNEYSLILSYGSKSMEHNNPNSPVKDTILNFTYNFYLDDNFFQITPKFEVYNYEEKKGIISKVIDSFKGLPNDYTFGQIISDKYIDFSRNTKNIICNKTSEVCVKIMLLLSISNPLEGIHFYKRSSVSIWDYLANIAALGTTLFNGLCKIFGLLYSTNFDNYKIIENIISKEIKNTKKNELNDNNTNCIRSNSSLEYNLIDKENLNKEKSNSEDIIINDIGEDNLDNEDDKMISKLPKLRFYDYFFNNVYSKCCIYIKRQKLIDACDNILYKYYSIENLLYNQILFDNLMKDYKWNNPELKSIHKNEFIKLLNKFISKLKII